MLDHNMLFQNIALQKEMIKAFLLVVKISSLVHRRLSCLIPFMTEKIWIMDALIYLSGMGQNLGLEGNFHLIGILQSIILS